MQGGLGYSGSGVEILNPSQGEGGRLELRDGAWPVSSSGIHHSGHIFSLGGRRLDRPLTFLSVCTQDLTQQGRRPCPMPQTGA